MAPLAILLNPHCVRTEDTLPTNCSQPVSECDENPNEGIVLQGTQNPFHWGYYALGFYIGLAKTPKLSWTVLYSKTLPT